VELTPEERAKIYAEEKARIEIRQKLADKAKEPKYSAPKPKSNNWIWIVGILIVIVCLNSIFNHNLVTEPIAPALMTVSNKQIDVSKSILGHWRAHNDEFYKGDDNLYFSERKVSDLNINQQSIDLLMSRNPDATGYNTVMIFHPKYDKDPDDDDFSAGPYPYFIQIDNKTNTAMITIIDFGNTMWRKQIIKFSDDLKSYKSIDCSTSYPAKGSTGNATWTYVDSSFEP
jgi:hypothetical protein